MRLRRGVITAALSVGVVIGMAGGALSVRHGEAPAPTVTLHQVAASPADVRYSAAVATAGYDPADLYWAAFARDTCADLRTGGGPSHIDDTDLGYVYGAAVGAYCLELADRTWYAR